MRKICVIGAGTMGNGIAHTFAQHGFEVALHDVGEEQLNQAVTTISRNMERQVKKEILTEEDKQRALTMIHPSTSLEESVSQAELVVEAATEKLEVKQEIFQQLDAICSPDTLLATNTSSISITGLAAVTARPQQVIGMHFMNPVPVMKLIEVIRGYATSPKVVNTITALAADLDKIPLVVNDYPGFVSNRVLMPMLNEAVYCLYEGIAGVEEIDQIMQLGMAHPMGPLKLADFIGLDVCLSIMRVLQQGFGNQKYAPCPLLVNMVTAGKRGLKSGVGFYDYRKNIKEPSVAE